ncbi:hypothetical protein PHLGIDRAFT_195276 [Phlebiopsis gigantea 11061_1 CR5-6]|uniref:Uncharacterized protein n=1 Tax=Phlebiopsis gigantea (strain 11061_1 CR5-6) TaxID=745531 RepID=A0A0C3PFL2_PHLG1|nr:hypothetical protein PHLGIDRAFT_195276 [Phlebiopsis gigantea 11061_1 CR5-6]
MQLWVGSDGTQSWRLCATRLAVARASCGRISEKLAESHRPATRTMQIDATPRAFNGTVKRARNTDRPSNAPPSPSHPPNAAAALSRRPDWSHSSLTRSGRSRSARGGGRRMIPGRVH